MLPLVTSLLSLTYSTAMYNALVAKVHTTTRINHCATGSMNEAKDSVLLERLGGQAAVDAVVEIFYEKLLNDDKLVFFFRGQDMNKLKRHQKKFMTFAFSDFPPDYDASKYLLARHKRLFESGLNELHFDMVAGHLVESLVELGVSRPLVDEAVAVVGKFRKVFEEGAILYGSSPVVDTPEIADEMSKKTGQII